MKADVNSGVEHKTEVIDDMVTRVIDENITAVQNRDQSSLFRLSDSEMQSVIEQPDWSRLEGSFSDLSLIGMGGMGTVFSAKDSLFYRNVALKIMRGELRNQEKNVNSFIREARITAQIDHPNIVPVYNLGVFHEMGPYFSMKKVDGITLSEVLKHLENNDAEYEKKYTLRHRLEIFINICNGLAFAHSKGVYHCDLKPGNIMLGKYGEVFIMDWGMAVYRSEKDLSSENRKINLGENVDNEKNITNPTVNGTPAFMAPEQIFGKIDSIDEQTDVYALGVILYAILTCTQSPFPAKMSAEEIFNKALAGDFLPPRKRAKKRQISNELEVICLKAMSPYKHERYANVMALIALLPASYDPDAKFLVNKRVLWNDIKGIVDEHKRPIFDPIEKTLCGYPVIVDDYVDAANKGLYLGYWKDIVGNLSKDIEVASNPHSGFTRAAIDYRGLAIFDSKPAKTDAIVRLVTTA